jgi:hypothetical protein
MKANSMDDTLIPGQLYRAVTETDVVELEKPVFEGMKLLIEPAQIRTLKKLQRQLRDRLGKKPDLMLVLNALIASSDCDAQFVVIAEWIRQRCNLTNE